MKISLYFDGTIDKNENPVFDFEKYKEKNEKQISEYFSSDELWPEISVMNGANQYEYRTFSDSMRYLLWDLKDENSATNRIFLGLDTNMEKRLDLFEKIFSLYITEHTVYHDHRTDTGYDAFYGRKGLTFRCYLPKDYLMEKYGEEYPFQVSPMAIGKEQILSITPFYYYELGAWDREKLRKDTDEMTWLRGNWIDKMVLGLA